MKRSELFLDDYATIGPVYKRILDGKEYEIEQYQGDHANEYCIYEVKKGVRDGSAALFSHGMVKMRWRMKKGVRDGKYVVFENGVAVREGAWSDVDVNEERVIENRRHGMVMAIRLDGKLIYMGEFNQSMERNGNGYEYEDGELKRYGKWENDKLIELKQEFTDAHEMIEYGSDSTSCLLSQQPVYIGGYKWDERNGVMKRDGYGRILNVSTGICEYESKWDNGDELESERIPLFHGWYCDHESEESIRHVAYPLITIGKEIAISNIFETKELVIANGKCNGPDITVLSLSNIPALKRITIGDHCFGSVRSFEVSDMNELESLVVGEDCFTRAHNWRQVVKCKPDNRSLKIMNCPKLKAIQIGNDSFSDYDSFEVTSVPSIHSIQLDDRCFYHAPSFCLKGRVE